MLFYKTYVLFSYNDSSPTLINNRIRLYFQEYNLVFYFNDNGNLSRFQKTFYNKLIKSNFI